MDISQGLNWIREHKVIAILRGIGEEHIFGVAQALMEGGIRAMEITWNTPGAENMIRGISEQFGDRMFIGAGTILDVQEFKKAALAGARFFVSPHLDETVIRLAVNRNLPAFPGAMTPQEVARAFQCGATAVKVFPGTLDHIKRLREIFPHIPLIGLGGVNPDNVGQYLSAGCFAVGVGSSILNKREIQAGNYRWIREQSARLTESIAAFLHGQNRLH